PGAPRRISATDPAEPPEPSAGDSFERSGPLPQGQRQGRGPGRARAETGPRRGDQMADPEFDHHRLPKLGPGGRKERGQRVAHGVLGEYDREQPDRDGKREAFPQPADPDLRDPVARGGTAAGRFSREIP